jgi:hypothetical protein
MESMSVISKGPQVNKNIVLMLACTAAATVSTAAQAQTATGFAINAEGYYYEFDEPGFDRQSGPYGTVGGSYTGYYFDTFWTADLRFGAGVTDFTSSASGTINNIWDYSSELRLIATRDIELSSDIILQPSLGLGYRVLYDNAGGAISSNGSIAINRLTQYLYWPVGIGFSFPAGSVTFKPSFEYDFLIDGNVTAYTAGLGGIDNNLSNDLNSGSGFRVKLDTEVQTTNGKLTFGPFLHYWSVRVSDLAPINAGGQTVADAFEPISHTWEAGFGASLKF